MLLKHKWPFVRCLWEWSEEYGRHQRSLSLHHFSSHWDSMVNKKQWLRYFWWQLCTTKICKLCQADSGNPFSPLHRLYLPNLWIRPRFGVETFDAERRGIIARPLGRPGNLVVGNLETLEIRTRVRLIATFYVCGHGGRAECLREKRKKYELPLRPISSWMSQKNANSS